MSIGFFLVVCPQKDEGVIFVDENLRNYEEDKKKIIIAEDNIELCELLSTILTAEGYYPDFVHDGFALINYLKGNQDVEVVILDLMMPDKDGLSIFDTIFSVSPASKVIIYSGYTSYSHSVLAKRAYAFINKADGVEKLLESLKEILG